MTQGPVTSPTATLARFASALSFDDIPAFVVRRAEDLLLDWIGSALAGKGARPIEAIERFARRMGPADGPSRSADLAPRHLAALRRDGERRRLALRRAGRRPQRLGVPSGRRRVPARARGRAGDRRLGPRAHRGRRRRLRSRHPRRRVPRPLALQGLPHDRHRGHARGRRRGGSPARPRRRPDAARVRIRRHAGRGPVGVPARRRRLQAAAHGEGRGRRAARRVSRRATASPARSGSSKDRRAWRPACRPTPIRRGSSTGSARAGRWPRRRSSGTRPAVTRIPPPTRCSRSSRDTISRPATSRA